MLRNGCPESIGMPGRNGSEQVAGISRNQWPEWSGIRTLTKMIEKTYSYACHSLPGTEYTGNS